MMKRRSFLQLSAATGLGLALGHWPSGGTARAAVSEQKKNLVLVYADGGWDPTAIFDPKPGVEGIDTLPGTPTAYADFVIWTDAVRPGVQAFFDAWAGSCTVINGINVPSIAHPGCRQRMLTGKRTPGTADVGALVGHHLGMDRPLPYLVLGSAGFVGPYGASTARAGTTTQLKTLIDVEEAYPPLPEAGYQRTAPNADEEALIREFVSARAERVRAVEGSRGYNKARIDDFLKSLERGDLLRERSHLVGKAKKTMDLNAQLNLAGVALEQGLARSIMVTANLDFDTHSDLHLQNGHLDSLFAGLSTLADDLAARPGSTPGSKLLDETVVLVVSEMGRTPRINATEGKDHWPITSALIFGAGVRGGGLCGGTDDGLLARGTDMETGAVDDTQAFIQPENLHASVLELVGLDPSAHFPDVSPLRGVHA